MSVRILQIVDRSRLHLACEFKTGIYTYKEHLVSLFNMKFFCAKAKFTLTELGKTRKYPWGMLI